MAKTVLRPAAVQDGAYPRSSFLPASLTGEVVQALALGSQKLSPHSFCETGRKQTEFRMQHISESRQATALQGNQTATHSTQTTTNENAKARRVSTHLHHLLDGQSEALGIELGEVREREAPALLARAKSHRAGLGIRRRTLSFRTHKAQDRRHTCGQTVQSPSSASLCVAITTFTDSICARPKEQSRRNVRNSRGEQR